MPTPTQNAISYTRFSSGNQARGSSLDRQSTLVAQWLLDHPDVTYHPDLSPEDLGVSGYSGAHLDAGLGTLLKAVELGTIGAGWTVLIESYDRLGRLEPLAMMQLLQQLIGAGLTLVTLEDRLEYSQTTIAANAGLLFLVVGKVQQAHSYSQSLSKRLKASYTSREKQAAEGQYVKRRSLWFIDTGTGRLKYPEADVARELFDLYLQGVGERALLKHVQTRLPGTGVKAPRSIRLLLQNRTCLGYWKEHLIYEPLVSEEVFYEVQQTFASRSRSPVAKPKSWLLTGLVRCGTCGSGSKINNNKGKSCRVQCSSRARLGAEGCSQKTSFAYIALDFIRSEVQYAALLRYANTKQVHSSTKELIVVKGKVEDLQSRIENILNLVERTAASQATQSRLTALQSELDALLAEEAALSQTAPTGTTADIEDLEEMANDMEGPELSRLLQQAGLVIEIFDDGSIVAEGHTYQYGGYNKRTGQYILTDESGEQIDLQQDHESEE